MDKEKAEETSKDKAAKKAEGNVWIDCSKGKKKPLIEELNWK